MIVLGEALLIGLCAGLIGTVYKSILAYEKILNWFFRFGDKYERKWFYKPIWGCGKCFAGQVAGWYWLFTFIMPAILTHPARFIGFASFWVDRLTWTFSLILGLFTAITAAILTAVILETLLKKIL